MRGHYATHICRVLNQGLWVSLPHVPSLTLVHASQQAPVHPWPSFSWLRPLERSGPLLRQFLLLTILYMKLKILFLQHKGRAWLTTDFPRLLNVSE